MTGPSTELPITKSQVRSIHIALHRQGIEDADYRALLDERFGVDTCKALNRRQASELLTRLGRKLPPPRPRARPRPALTTAARRAGNVTALATPKQRTLIADLSAEVAWREADGFGRWLRRNMGLERVRTSAEAARVIEGLKAMKARQAA